jgi:hypothetical protein
MAKEPPIDWELGDDLIVRKQMPIRAYLNRHGNVVICQEAEDPHEDDPFIVIRPENVRAVIAGLTRLADRPPEEVK